MSDPLVPNYKRNVGRLVVDRYQFEEHIQGDGYNHTADQIILSPTVEINSIELSNVQDAVEAMATYIAPVVPPATSGTRGTIQLSGDITGSYNNIVVSGLRGYPVANLTPSSNQVLRWNGTAWTPSTLTGFVPGSDLSGSATSQQIVRITGDVNSEVDIVAENLLFNSSIRFPLLSQDVNLLEDGNNLSITAQTTTAATKNGGDVIVSGGSPGSGGRAGGVILAVNSGNNIMLQGDTLSTGNRVLGLVTNSTVTSTNMPANTGNMVTFIANAVTPPTTGNPVGGAILYASSGKLRTKFADGYDFEIGSTPNPNTWGNSFERVIRYRASTTSNGVTAMDVFSYTVPNNHVVYVDVLAVGKLAAYSPNDAYQARVSMGYTVDNSGNIGSIGSLAYTDERYTAGASSWTKPVIRTDGVGTTVIVSTGASSSVSDDTVWILNIEFTITNVFY